MKDKLNVLVIPTWMPYGKDKNMGVYHQHFCEALSRHQPANVNVIFIERIPLKKLLSYITMTKKTAQDENGYRVFRYRMLNVSPVSFSWQTKRYAKKLKKAYKDYIKQCEKPDVIHAQVCVPAGYASIELAKEINVPVVVTEHSSYFRRYFSGKEGTFMQSVLKHAYCTCVSKYMLDAFKEKGVPCEQLPNLVDTSLFSPIERPAPDDTLKLVSVCALRVGKRIDLMAQAMKKAMETGLVPNIHLTVVGDGFYGQIYKNAVSECGMSDHVTFAGQVPHDDLEPYYHDAHALIVASEKETFGIPGIEALATGMPVISTRNGGMDEYLDESCAELCSVNDVDDMAQAIGRMYKRLRSGDFTTGHLLDVASQFDTLHVSEKAMGIYRDLISGKKSPLSPTY
ncbi:MAG: glycosyltransferase [Clostridia bacterium]|nr:glycosyltransferase [Clostridia bacterium]